MIIVKLVKLVKLFIQLFQLNSVKQKVSQVFQSEIWSEIRTEIRSEIWLLQSPLYAYKLCLRRRKVRTRPCTTVRDSEEILGGYSLQKYLSVWLMGISFLISLNNPLFKNITHVGSFCYLVIWCICVFVFLYLHVWLMWISFLISLNNPL